jgi:hypothetical protein
VSINLHGATQFEPSSQVIFGFDNREDAFWFYVVNYGRTCQLHVLEDSDMVLIDAPVDCLYNLVQWLKDHLSSTSWGVTELVRVSFSTDADWQQFEAAL